VTVRFVDIGGIVDRHCLYKYCHIGPFSRRKQLFYNAQATWKLINIV